MSALLNANHAERVVLLSHLLPWVGSPEPGVDRRLLERDGDEQARATSIVRYAPGARFHRHTHPLGEEFLVLDGTFRDEHGTYAAGTYVRNPPGSSHQPASESGCLLFVKLRYMHVEERDRTVIHTRQQPWLPGLVDGLSVMPLASLQAENTALVRWAPGTRFNTHRHWGGEEIFVLDGVFEDEHGRYPAGAWLRNPHMSQHRPFSTEGCTIFVKTGHLLGASAPAGAA